MTKVVGERLLPEPSVVLEARYVDTTGVRERGRRTLGFPRNLGGLVVSA